MASIQDMPDAARPVCSWSKAILLDGGHVTRGAMRVADVEAAFDASYCVRVSPRGHDGLVQRGANLGNLIPGGSGVVGTHNGPQ